MPNQTDTTMTEDEYLAAEAARELAAHEASEADYCAWRAQQTNVDQQWGCTHSNGAHGYRR